MNILLREIADYYSKKIVEHGLTHHGVDWNSHESQYLRFEQLTKVINSDETFSINDLGCGYGALFDYLLMRYEDFKYYGCDISDDMIKAANIRNTKYSNAHFNLSAELAETADYSVASGIFNVRLSFSNDKWNEYLETTLNLLNSRSRKGFSFNCLTIYSDTDKMHDYLYYANPCVIFDFCKRNYSRDVALLHDYGLYEFTIIVRKHQ